MKFNFFVLVVIVSLSPFSAFDSRGSCSQEKLKLVECAENHVEYIDSLKNVTGKEIFDRNYMLAFSSFTKDLSTCFGNVLCDSSRHYLFFLKALSYTIDKIYNDAYSCFSVFPDTNIIHECFIMINTGYDQIREMHEDFNELLKCIMEELQGFSGDCSQEVSDELKKAFVTVRYIWQHYRDWIQQKMRLTVFDEKNIVLE